LEQNRGAAAAGGTICYYPEKGRIWCAGGKFIPWRASSFPSYLDEPVDRIVDSPVREVTFVTGCLMLLRTSALRRVGLLDERFFMYLEDAELSFRLVAAGFRLLYVPKARIYHKINHRGDKPLPVYYGMRNRLLFVKLTTRGATRVIATGQFLLTACLKMLIWRIRYPHLFVAAKMGLTDYFRNAMYEGRGLTLTHHGDLGPDFDLGRNSA
jgi:GT2 family glycosyltransferase